MDKIRAVDIIVFGIVQGVGFRPFVYRTAKELGYKGWVKNIGFGVEIHLEAGKPEDFSAFFYAFDKNKPPLSLIEKMEAAPAEFRACQDFSILKTSAGESFVFISPDISICESCRKELMSRRDRRYRYPFINCTDCGPRYTIVEDLPYDRDKTTMKDFQMCSDCSKEYSAPLDRRYHAQPIACPVCGPKVQLYETDSHRPISGGIEKTIALIQEGHILAVKGLGGFHLVCDPFNDQAVFRLRELKNRQRKPLALMARDRTIVQRFCRIDQVELDLLQSARRPIILLKKKRDIPGIAPGLDEIGFMLPYTPLHHLLLEKLELIVATSSNRKDSPIIKDEEEELFQLCDYILSHDRPIKMRADDSVMKTAAGKPLFIRRARGYVPYPQAVPPELKFSGHILALGGELKDTVSVYKNGYVVTSQFLGDLDEYQNYTYFSETIEHLSRLFEIKPEVVVSDLHPDFHTTRFARKMGIPHLRVQHHYAHILAPMLEHKLPPGKKVLGVAWDGFGYGADGTAWGGEFLLADYNNYQRLTHFKNVPLPGGDLAAKQPWRMALAYLDSIFGQELPKLRSLEQVEDRLINGVKKMISQKICCPQSSSCGRLFDAVSFLTGIAPPEVEFEAEAPMLLEAAAADNESGVYPLDFPKEEGNPISWDKTIKSIVDDTILGVPRSIIAARFHNTLAAVIKAAAEFAREKHNIDTVVLSGGVFLNKILLEAAQKLLEAGNFKVLRPVLYSPNDESISIGQVAYALASLTTSQA